MKTPFLGGAYLSRSVNLNAQRCVNLYPEMTTEGGRDVGAFFGTPGLTTWCDTGNASEVRGLHVAGGYLYAVVGTDLFKITTGGSATDIGTVAGTGPVMMTNNGTQMLIANGDAGVLVTLATSAIAAPGGAYPSGAQTCAFIDGYFLVEDPGTQAVYQSDVYDGATWDALNYASKEGAPDDLVAVLADHRELWLFGDQTTEVWYNAGATGFAFARIQGAFMEHGCTAVYSVAKMDNSVYWLGQDANGRGMVFRAVGYAPQRISTHAIEYAIAGYATISDAVAWTYQQEGHAFYCLSFPTAGVTWCYDASTQFWHERRGFSAGAFARHRANCAVMFAGKNLVGDYANGKIYELDLDTYADGSDTIKRLRSWGHVNNDGRRLLMSELRLIMQTGIGLDGDVQGSDPQVMLRWSDDGGHTWSNENWKPADAGAIGRYGQRVVWRRLGITRDRVFEISMTDPVKPVFIAAELDARPVG